MTTEELVSPAKVNLILLVDGEDEKGYHFIETLVTPISLSDRILVEVGDGDGFHLHSNVELPENNTLRRAYELFKRETGISFSMKVKIEKKIPIGGGLGGGSSNAGVLLKFLNRLFSNPLDEGELVALSSKVGMDVPMFVLGGSLWLSGRGEVVRKRVKLPKIKMVLVYPGFPSPTGEIYKRTKPKCVNLELPDQIELDELIGLIENHLEEPFLQLFPEALEVKRALEALSPLKVSLTGSGSSYFAVFSEFPDDEELKTLKAKGWRVFKVEGGGP